MEEVADISLVPALMEPVLNDKGKVDSVCKEVRIRSSTAVFA